MKTIKEVKSYGVSKRTGIKKGWGKEFNESRVDVRDLDYKLIKPLIWWE